METKNKYRMHKIITGTIAFIIMILAAVASCQAQTKTLPITDGVNRENLKKDTLSVSTNQIQLERLNAIQEKINANQKEFADLLELIFGVKIEDVEWWGFKQGKFQFILKPKKK